MDDAAAATATGELFEVSSAVKACICESIVTGSCAPCYSIKICYSIYKDAKASANRETNNSTCASLCDLCDAFKCGIAFSAFLQDVKHTPDIESAQQLNTPG